MGTYTHEKGDDFDMTEQNGNRPLAERGVIIALVGMTGSGKTTVARHLSAMLGCRYFDLDRLIEMKTGKTVRALFDESGEAAFRETERACLENTLRSLGEKYPVSVLSTGGGVVLNRENVELLKREAISVCLVRAVSDVMKHERTMARPPINGDPDTYRRIAKEREPLYRSASDYFIFNRNSEESAAQILQFLKNRPDCARLKIGKIRYKSKPHNGKRHGGF